VSDYDFLMASDRKFTFVCGQDDYLVNRLGQERFNELCKDIEDEFSRDTVSGFAGNGGEVEAAINRFRESVQTVPMFGGKRAVWLKDVNFLADSVTGRSDGTLKQVEDLQELLSTINPAEVAVLITASPVDRRRAFLKWCEKNAHAVVTDSESDGLDAFAPIVLAEAKLIGVTIDANTVELLIEKVGANTRLLVEEVRKLASFAPEIEGKIVITEDHVESLSPNFAEGDFFEAAEAFFSGNINRTLDALHRHFFSGGDARPVLAALQNRNRLLLQLRSLADSGDIKLGPRGVDGLAKAAALYNNKYAESAGVKSAYNIFTQHPFYLGKLASGKLPTLKRLIDNQHDFITAFEAIIKRPNEQEDVLRDMAVKCLSVAKS
jgi:DNA polymerase-3 subunit delta